MTDDEWLKKTEMDIIEKMKKVGLSPFDPFTNHFLKTEILRKEMELGRKLTIDEISDLRIRSWALGFSEEPIEHILQDLVFYELKEEMLKDRVMFHEILYGTYPTVISRQNPNIIKEEAKRIMEVNDRVIDWKDWTDKDAPKQDGEYVFNVLAKIDTETGAMVEAKIDDGHFVATQKVDLSGMSDEDIEKLKTGIEQDLKEAMVNEVDRLAEEILMKDESDQTKELKPIWVDETPNLVKLTNHERVKALRAAKLGLSLQDYDLYLKGRI
jgi:hypothetical protein